MTRDIINVQCPVVDVTQSVADVTVEKTVINTTNGITIKNAFKNKNNTLMICVENTADKAGEVTFLAGNAYPNSMLGKLAVPVEANSTTMLQIQDASRFENKDGSVNLDFSTDVAGNIYAVAKSVALNV